MNYSISILKHHPCCQRIWKNPRTWIQFSPKPNSTKLMNGDSCLATPAAAMRPVFWILFFHPGSSLPSRRLKWLQIAFIKGLLEKQRTILICMLHWIKRIKRVLKRCIWWLNASTAPTWWTICFLNRTAICGLKRKYDRCLPAIYGKKIICFSRACWEDDAGPTLEIKIDSTFQT